MDGFIIRSTDNAFMIDLINWLNNYKPKDPSKTIVFNSSDIEKYLDAIGYIKDHDLEESFNQYRNCNGI